MRRILLVIYAHIKRTPHAFDTTKNLPFAYPFATIRSALATRAIFPISWMATRSSVLWAFAPENVHITATTGGYCMHREIEMCTCSLETGECLRSFNTVPFIWYLALECEKPTALPAGFSTTGKNLLQLSGCQLLPKASDLHTACSWKKMKIPSQKSWDSLLAKSCL